jgi:alanine-synthesizing transaminase
LNTNLAELDRQLTTHPSCKRLLVEGGWYVVLRVPVIQSDEELAIRLLREAGVSVHPGHFYDFPGDGHLVLSLITDPAIFSKGLTKLMQVLNFD